MGGTWVTHHMGHLFHEMVRYGLDRDLVTTGSPRTNQHDAYYSLNVPGAFYTFSYSQMLRRP